MTDSVRRRFERQMTRLWGRWPSLVLYVSPPSSAADFPEPFRRRVVEMASPAARWLSEATGEASVGKIVVVAATRDDFTGRFWEDVRQVAAPARKNITLIATPTVPPAGPESRPDDFALMRGLDGADVLAPCDAEEMEQAMEYAVTRHSLTYLRCPGDDWEAEAPPVFNGACRFAPGVWPVLRAGDAVTLISCGHLAADALAAARKIASAGVPAAVLHASSVCPVDRRALADAAKKSRIVITLEEHAAAGGLGGAVAETLADLDLSPRLRRLSFPPAPWRTSTIIEAAVRTALALTAKSKRAVLSPPRRFAET